MAEVLVIAGHAFPVRARSDAPTEEGRREENLHFAACDSLEELRKVKVPPYFRENCTVDTWQSWLMFLLPRVAKHFEVDREELAYTWAKHYGVGLAFEVRRMLDGSDGQ